MKYLSAIVVMTSLLIGCTKFEVKEVLPEISDITPSSMVTNLDRIDIQVDPDAWEYMYTNYQWDIKIPATITYYNASGDSIFNSAATVEVKGAGSAQYVMKSLGIVFNTPIDNEIHQIVKTDQALPGDNLNTLKSIRLRNSGNDFGNTQLKDLALTELAIQNSIDLELKYGKPVHAFVNGAYYGLLNLRTENDPIALADLLQVDENTITIMKMDFPETDLDFREGDETLAQEVIDAIEQEDAAKLKSLIDISNLVDYILFEDYVGNSDWPHNNLKMYSVDGSKFRFLLFDLDLAASRNRTQRLPKLEYLEDDFSRIYQILRANDPSFNELLEARQSELYANLSVEKFSTIVDELAKDIDPEIGYLITKWGPPYSTFEWRLNIDKLKQDFSVNEFYNRKIYGFL